MYRRIAKFLILLVLFTHSTMAMDVHIPHDDADHITDSSNISTAINLDQPSCIDAGGHCSHHQAHTSGLFSVNTLGDIDCQSVLFALLKTSAFTHTQAPPLRPPKA